MTQRLRQSHQAAARYGTHSGLMPGATCSFRQACLGSTYRYLSTYLCTVSTWPPRISAGTISFSEAPGGLANILYFLYRRIENVAFDLAVRFPKRMSKFGNTRKESPAPVMLGRHLVDLSCPRTEESGGLSIPSSPSSPSSPSKNRRFCAAQEQSCPSHHSGLPQKANSKKRGVKMHHPAPWIDYIRGLCKRAKSARVRRLCNKLSSA